jgi:hypothetical protein
MKQVILKLTFVNIKKRQDPKLASYLFASINIFELLQTELTLHYSPNVLIAWRL